MRLAAAFLTALLFVYLTMPFFRGLAARFRIIDFPNKRKMHRTVTPLTGGLAIYAGFVAGMCFFPRAIGPLVPILAGGTMILVLGLGDDMRGLSPRFRIVIQCIAALTVVVFGDRINFLPPTAYGDFLEILVSLVWIIGITNAFNYLDGLDGLAAGSATINLACFGIILYTTNQPHLFVMSVVLIAACLGFLPHNFGMVEKRGRKIFLGDAGSTFLGFMLASIGLVGYWAEGSAVKISIPVLVLGVPIFDMTFTTVMRIAEKKIGTVHEWLKYADRDHFHHYLFDLGLKTGGAVIFIYCTSISLGLSAIMVSKGRTLIAALSILQGVIIFGIIAVLIVMGKRGQINR